MALIALLAFSVRALRGLQVQVTGGELDGAQYDAFAVDLARYWQGVGSDPGAWLGKDGFPAMLATIYSTIGHAPEIGYLINAFAGGLAVLVVAATTSQMGWNSAIKPSALIVGFWPAGIVWGGMLVREAIVALLLAVGMWGTVRLYKLQFVSGAVAIVAAGSAMIFMRGGLAFLVLVGMPLTAVIVANVRGRPSPLRWLLSIVTIAAAFVALSLLGNFFQGAQYFEYRGYVTEDQNRGSSSFASAGLGGTAVSPSLLGHLLRLPVTALGPLPWQVTNLSLVLAAFDAVLWLAVFGLAFYATTKLERKMEALLFAAPFLSLIVALAATAGNFGLIIRLRGQGIVLLAPLAALGYVYLLDRRSARKVDKSLRVQSNSNSRDRSIHAGSGGR